MNYGSKVIGNHLLPTPYRFINWVAGPTNLNGFVTNLHRPSADGDISVANCHVNTNIPRRYLSRSDPCAVMEGDIRNSFVTNTHVKPSINRKSRTVFESNFKRGLNPRNFGEVKKFVNPEFMNPIVDPLMNNTKYLKQESTTSDLSPAVMSMYPSIVYPCAICRENIFKSPNDTRLFFPLTSTQTNIRQRNFCSTDASFGINAQELSMPSERSGVAPKVQKEPNAKSFIKFTVPPFLGHQSNCSRILQQKPRQKIRKNKAGAKAAGRLRTMARVRLFVPTSTGKEKRVVIKVDPSVPSMNKIKIEHGYSGDIFIGNFVGACSQKLCLENNINIIINLSTKKCY